MTIPWPRAPCAQTAGAPIFSTPHPTSCARAAARVARGSADFAARSATTAATSGRRASRAISASSARSASAFGDPEPPERDARLAQEGDEPSLRDRGPLAGATARARRPSAEALGRGSRSTTITGIPASRAAGRLDAEPTATTDATRAATAA